VKLTAPAEQPWREPASYWRSIDAATVALDPVFGVLHLGALSHNAFDMVRRAGGKPIRVASKSVRVRDVLRAALAVDGYGGILAFTLPEALWLAESFDDIVVGYPIADRAAYAALGRSEHAERIAVMVDSVEQLDLIDSASPPAQRVSDIRVCLELDASFRSRVLGNVGVWRSPVRDAAASRALAEQVQRRRGFRLVGMMSYEAQVAGLGNAPAGKPLMGMVLRRMQKASMAELVDRRVAAVTAVRAIADLSFVNGGGTGSLEVTAADPSITEIAAGSGLFGPHLFDNYAHFSPAPAAAFAVPVVRRAAPGYVTLLGGGWIASGPHGADRTPQIAWPPGLKLVPREGAGEVQTPVRGAAADSLGIGDRVWLRHTKAGELSEHLNELHVIDGNEVVGTVPTYRGEGKAFV
jgi:D-serine deaminase-like pyridoxal phosphate-dependent protein